MVEKLNSSELVEFMRIRRSIQIANRRFWFFVASIKSAQTFADVVAKDSPNLSIAIVNLCDAEIAKWRRR